MRKFFPFRVDTLGANLFSKGKLYRFYLAIFDISKGKPNIFYLAIFDISKGTLCRFYLAIFDISKGKPNIFYLAIFDISKGKLYIFYLAIFQKMMHPFYKKVTGINTRGISCRSTFRSKDTFFNQRVLIFFISSQDTSNECPQCRFLWRNRKMLLLGYPSDLVLQVLTRNS